MVAKAYEQIDVPRFIQYYRCDIDNTVVKLKLVVNLLLKRYIPIDMLSTRNQKAKEKRSSQFDAMSDIENFDVMLGNYHDGVIRDQENVEGCGPRI